MEPTYLVDTPNIKQDDMRKKIFRSLLQNVIVGKMFGV